MTSSGTSSFSVSGAYEVIEYVPEFTDVPAGEWYSGYVYAAVRLGLIDGMNATTFSPEGSFTVAQAVKIARMHAPALLRGGGSRSENGADPEWYSTFLDYALENGVAGAEYAEMSASELNSAISRRDYVALFYKRAARGGNTPQ